MIASALVILIAANVVGSVSQQTPEGGKHSYCKMHLLFSLYFALYVTNYETDTLRQCAVE